MALLVMLLLAVPALAQPADCASVPVGPPIAMELYVGPPRRANVPGRVIGGVVPMEVPAFGTLCRAPPPLTRDVLRGPPAPEGVLHGPPAPRGVLRGDGLAEVLRGWPVLAPADAAPPSR